VEERAAQLDIELANREAGHKVMEDALADTCPATFVRQRSRHGWHVVISFIFFAHRCQVGIGPNGVRSASTRRSSTALVASLIISERQHRKSLRGSLVPRHLGQQWRS